MQKESPFRRLSSEIYAVRKEAKNYPSIPFINMVAGLKARESNIHGIEGISGIGENLTVFLEEPLDFEVLENMVSKYSTTYEIKHENILGRNFDQLKAFPIITLGLPIIALDGLKEGRSYLEIRKGFLQSFHGVIALSKYLEEKYGLLDFKENARNYKSIDSFLAK